jgi:hypothetical protein
MKPPAIVLLLSLACASAPAPRPDPAPAPAPPAGCGEGGTGEEGGIERPGQPRFLPPAVGSRQLLVDVEDPRYKLELPPEHAHPGASYVALFKICVSDAGQVTSVNTLKGTCVSQIDDAWSAKIKTWTYRPWELKGSPYPFCYPMRAAVRTSP